MPVLAADEHAAADHRRLTEGGDRTGETEGPFSSSRLRSAAAMPGVG